MSFSATFSSRAFKAEAQTDVESLKQAILQAFNYATPSPRSKQYKRVRVLLVHWDQGDRRIENEVGRIHDAFK